MKRSSEKSSDLPGDPPDVDNPKIWYMRSGIRFWRDDPLGQPKLGTLTNIDRLDRDTLVGFKRDNYTPEETVVCAAGNIQHDRFVDLVEKQMRGFPRGSTRPHPPLPRMIHPLLLSNAIWNRCMVALPSAAPVQLMRAGTRHIS